MNIADARRHGIHGTGDEALRSARFDDFATGRDTVTLRNFRATQPADQGPHRVVMHRRRRISSLYEAHNPKALPRVRVQQVLSKDRRARRLMHCQRACLRRSGPQRCSLETVLKCRLSEMHRAAEAFTVAVQHAAVKYRSAISISNLHGTVWLPVSMVHANSA